MSSTILVVEDEHDARDVMSRLLKSVGDVDSVVSAEDALVNIQEKHYQLAVIDLSLPEMDGFELLQNIRQDGHTMQCIAVTAFHTPELEQQALQAGFDGYHPKPIDHMTFMASLGSL